METLVNHFKRAAIWIKHVRCAIAGIIFQSSMPFGHRQSPRALDVRPRLCKASYSENQVSLAWHAGLRGWFVADRRVALLRGVNVGKAKRVAMADLRKLVEGLGYGDVRTLLNSGNVLFTVPAGMTGDAAARIENAIGARLGVAT